MRRFYQRTERGILLSCLRKTPRFTQQMCVTFRIILAWQRDFTFFSWAIKHQRFTDDLYITGAGFAHDSFHDQGF